MYCFRDLHTLGHHAMHIRKCNSFQQDLRLATSHIAFCDIVAVTLLLSVHTVHCIHCYINCSSYLFLVPMPALSFDTLLPSMSHAFVASCVLMYISTPLIICVDLTNAELFQSKHCLLKITSAKVH